MWTYHGREFPAPTFELGMAPAGSMYSTVHDLSRFLRMLFAAGEIDGERIVEGKTLESMWAPQFVKPGTREGFGLGFSVGRFQGRRRIGHGGAIYGFATDLSALPDDRLGVVVVSSCDCANAVSTRIADAALAHLFALKEKKPLPAIEETTPLKEGEANKLAGRYEGKSSAFDLVASAGRLYYFPARGGFRVELRRQGEALVGDDRLGWGTRLTPTDDGFRLGKQDYRRALVKKPAPCPAKWRGLIGEYGWDHNALVILEKDGKLHALIEWFFLYPLEEESEDVYAFPADFGLYHGEKLVFRRGRAGRATEVEAASVVFRRRRLDGEDGTFKIKPLRPVEELRKEALRATPPEERGVLFRKPELVELVKLEAAIKLDIRYASTDNFLSTPFYRSAKAFMQRPAAEALVRVHRGLAKEGHGLLVHDGYRPWSVTKMFWDATPPNLRVFVADPAQGSRHNRGCAVDLTLYDKKTGKPVEMVGGYDEMSDRSYPDYVGGTSLARWHRDLLRRAMEAEGFTVFEAEWWHFDYKDWRKYPIGNLTFEEVASEGKKEPPYVAITGASARSGSGQEARGYANGCVVVDDKRPLACFGVQKRSKGPARYIYILLLKAGPEHLSSVGVRAKVSGGSDSADEVIDITLGKKTVKVAYKFATDKKTGALTSETLKVGDAEVKKGAPRVFLVDLTKDKVTYTPVKVDLPDDVPDVGDQKTWAPTVVRAVGRLKEKSAKVKEFLDGPAPKE
jgi:serine beta-lactamase-like protein LACTB